MILKWLFVGDIWEETTFIVKVTQDTQLSKLFKAILVAYFEMAGYSVVTVWERLWTFIIIQVCRESALCARQLYSEDDLEMVICQ